MNNPPINSIGFASAQEMIEAIKSSSIKANIKWGGYRAAFRYILAPENGSAGDVGSMDFEEIWQYGSDLNQPGADPMWLQDGVAPQSMVGGLDAGNRAYIPKNQGIPKGFLESHSISNYGWIFKQQVEEPGHVTPK